MCTDSASKHCPEELILYGLLVVIGAIPVIEALVQQTTFGVEATVGLLMVCAGLVGTIACAWQAMFRERKR
jgi:hypothetical protein